MEEGLETKSKGAPKTTDKSTSIKKKSSAMFCKPYFKDKDQKVFPVDILVNLSIWMTSLESDNLNKHTVISILIPVVNSIQSRDTFEINSLFKLQFEEIRIVMQLCI